MKTLIFTLTFLIFVSCAESQIKTPKNAMTKFEQFKAKDKFVEDMKIFYPGIADPKLKLILSEKINRVAESFKVLAESKNPNESEYLNEIEKGLLDFSGLKSQLDTEDRERICHYFEELMDIVGLESSDGKLNNFMYGF